MIVNSGRDTEYPLFENCCHLAYRYFPFLSEEIWVDEKLNKAIDLLELRIESKELHALSSTTAFFSVLSIFLILIASFLMGFSLSLLFVFFIIFPLILYLYIERYPVMLMESRKMEMVGHIPAIASYLVISLRISPTLEKAVEFTSEHTTGFPRRLLKKIISDIHMGRSSSIVESLSKFADEWGNIPEFRAFMQLLIASTLEASEKGRCLMLDNGMNVLLNGLKERTDNAARQLETPILMIFTFLVILPLVFIGLIPLIPTLGINISPLIIFFLYDIVLPVILFIAISFIVSTKPITIPPIEIPSEEHSKVFNMDMRNKINRCGFLLSILLIAAIISLPGILDLMAAIAGKGSSYPLGTSSILIGVSLGLGIYLLGTSYNVKKMRDEIKKEEAEFIETLRQLSVLLSSGRPLPNAMAHITDLNKGKSAGIFSKAANNIRLFNMDIREAFFNEEGGSAAKIYSGMIRGSIDTIIAMSGRSSKAIASVLIRLSEHIRNMKTVDVEMKKIIGSVTSSMNIIAIFVGPLVGGVATSLGYLISATLGDGDLGFGFGEMIKTMNPEIVKLIIGVYVLETTVILSLFSDDLIYGNDRVIKKYHLGMYLPFAALLFALSIYMMQGILTSVI